jgi:predicted lipoprotein with Yx(FWY)xxD motif
MKPKSFIALGLAVAVVAIATVVLAAVGSAKTGGPQVAGGTAVSVRHTSLGETLTDANGRTLYLFERDRPNVSNLSAAGRAVWPPFTAVGMVKAAGAAQAAKLGTTSGPVKQVTYNGHPLYYYIGDHAGGSTNGQHLKEFGALWYVLSPSGRAITSTATRSPTATGAPAGNYGY